MNKSVRGVLTIEAAVALPLVIIAFVSVLFFAKVYYIQDQIHSAMVKTAHDMSVEAYSVDKLGLIDLQQRLYSEGADSMAGINDAAGTVADNAALIQSNSRGMTDYGQDLSQWFGEAEAIEWGDDFTSVAKGAMVLIERGPVIVEELSGNIGTMVTALQTLYEEAKSGMSNVAMMEAVDFSNGLVAGQMSKSVFSRYMNDEQLEAYGVSAGIGNIDFSMSSYLLYDDTIELVAAYTIDLPYGNEWFGHSVPVFQKVRARAWTGSYEAGELKHRKEPSGESETVEKIYYIAEGDPSNHSYHYYTCLRKVLTESTYEKEVIQEKRSICIYCRNHYEVVKDMSVFYTSTTSKIHLFHQCPRVYSENVRAVTSEELKTLRNGEGMLYDPCDIKGCVGKTEGK